MNWTDEYAKEIKLKVTELYFDDNDTTEQKIATSAEVADMLNNLIELKHFDAQNRWTVGETVPGLDTCRILAMFEGENADVYAYCYPMGDTPTNAKEWRRYTLNRMGFVATLEVMTRETFVNEVVQEFESLLDTEEEDEPELQPAASLPS